MRSASDEKQLEYASSYDLCVVTHNRVDFENLARAYIASGKHHAGIVIAVRRHAHEVARRLLALMDSVTADEIVDQIRYL
jgi:hypothetical protein